MCLILFHQANIRSVSDTVARHVRAMGEESLMGKDVNFVFRMERLAGSLGISLLTSVEGKSRLDSFMRCETVGAHELKGFEGNYEFFSC